MNKMIYNAWIIVCISIILYCSFSLTLLTESFVPMINQTYRPIQRNIRTICEGFAKKIQVSHFFRKIGIL